MADDSEIVREATSRLLKGDSDIQLVAQAVNFSQTIQLIGTLRPAVVVMDMHMDDEREVTPLLVKSCLNGSRLVAISLWNDIATQELADSYGAVVLLDKLNLYAELIPAIKRCANGAVAAKS